MKSAYKGFTLIEITLVIVLIAILLAITTPLVSSVVNRNDVGVAHESLYNGLLRAQQLSKNNYQNSQWRVCLDNSNKQYTITSGPCSDPTNAEIIKISSNITISSEQTLDIAFKAISGELDSTSNSITITLTGGGASKSIIVNKIGILSKSPTSEEIAAIPPSKLTVTSCTYANKKISIPYTAGEVGYNYTSQTINSTGVTGLTATLLGDGPLATGGDTTTDITVGADTYRVHTFTTVGTSSLNVIQGGEFEYLVVGGGGGGGMDMGGGGGGGGVLKGTLVSTPQDYTVTVGGGGTGAPAACTGGQPCVHQYTIPATSGGNSSFASLFAIGGGFGGSSYRGYTPGIAGGSGGSGGGSSGYNDNAGTFLGGLGTSGQGNRGGNSTAAYYSGGGGGAGAPGADSTNQPNGGIGVENSILGVSYFWGGGGGGASYSLSTGGNGGNGGGGGGALGTTSGGSGLNPGSPGGGGGSNQWANTPGGNAGANTGGGGGGGSHYNSNNKGGNGGSGIVIVRYKLGGAGTLASSGTLEYLVTGTPGGVGNANFDLSNIGNMGVGCNNSNIAVNVTGSLATGGTVTDITVGADTYRVHTFTTVGTSSLNVIQGGEFEYLVVAGGGPSAGGITGTTYNGGGGGGQVLSSTTTLSGSSFSVTVGTGSSVGSNGGSSAFGSITALGGNQGGNGGSNGNGGNSGSGNAGGSWVGGGVGGGGGGGNSAVGSSNSGASPGAGGLGTASSISGSSVTYGTGGTGGCLGCPGVSNGATNRGNGGGGNSGNGGSGIVIVRYKLLDY